MNCALEYQPDLLVSAGPADRFAALRWALGGCAVFWAAVGLAVVRMVS